jgi:hypothetical protein
MVVPIIVDPNDYDKSSALDVAMKYVDEFLIHNELEDYSDLITHAEGTCDENWTGRGFYDSGTRQIYVNLKASLPPVKTPGFSWSFTGYKADLTAPGVLAHEVGHHVQNMLELGRVGRVEIVRLMNDVRKHEPQVSSYEPNIDESFAEAMKLFILNPELLRVGRPKRWSVLTNVLGLKPLHDEDWRCILQHAHVRLIAAAENWIARSR